MAVISIVGYTNAGKSTLLNRLTDAGILTEDKLFATLDPTTRRVELPSGKEVLFTDTVGFIQKLPTQLVASFRATLEEVNEADVLIHVTDISDRNLLQKVEAVEDILEEIEAAGKPTVLALNKVDLVDPDTDIAETTNRFVTRHTAMDDLTARYDRVISISAEQGVGIEELLRAVEEILTEQMVDFEAVLPYQASDILNLWHRQGIIAEQSFRPQGIAVRGKLPKWLVGLVEEAALPTQRAKSRVQDS